MSRMCPNCGAPMIGESRRPEEPPDEEDLRCEAGCDDDEERCVGCGRTPSEGIGCSSCPGYNSQGYDRLW